jgi:hypothetical protein
VTPAARTWTWDRDGTNWLSPAVDAFVSPGSTIRVSAWTVPLDGQAIESWADVEAWASDYCTRAHDAPCTGIHDRVVPMCIETRDCHPALIVPFKDDVIFFGTGGVLPPGMTVVAVWRGESDPSTAPFGGSRPLLEAFLSTMGVFPPRYGESQGAAATFMATGR